MDWEEISKDSFGRDFFGDLLGVGLLFGALGLWKY